MEKLEKIQKWNAQKIQRKWIRIDDISSDDNPSYKPLNFLSLFPPQRIFSIFYTSRSQASDILKIITISLGGARDSSG